MNIKQAKEHIKNTVRLYLKKDEFGEYRVPAVRQRPVFLLGAPGIGKTAIMEQIAQEMGIALVAYSMTHHTRQSALGLPFITEKVYGGAPVKVSEYTMSEIIASVYDTMEETGIREGILFLDEINCVSETLAPVMLQFLQYKIFGCHKVPSGWVIVTAGNPPEYNKSVREFDVVTLDRLKVMEVEPDYSVWREYAAEKRIHSAVTGFLDLKRECFYHMEMTAAGRSYVTARGWEDLSQMLILHEEEGAAAGEALIGQYLRNVRITKEFAVYYELYQKYKRTYHVEEILAGTPLASDLERARTAAFDERLSLLGMLSDQVQSEMKDVLEQAAFLKGLKPLLKRMEGADTAEGDVAEGTLCEMKAMDKRLLACVDSQIEEQMKFRQKLERANALSEEEDRKSKHIVSFLEECIRDLLIREKEPLDGREAYAFIKEKYNSRVVELKRNTDCVQKRLHGLFSFAEAAFGQENEMLILVTELTRSSIAAQFIAAFGSPDYRQYSEKMMLDRRREEIGAQIALLDL